MIIVLSALLGLIIGSFLNVVILRHGVRTLGGRSACPHCNHALAAYDLVPLFSWLYLRGACRYCKSAISAQYTLVEATTAALFAILFSLVQDPYTLFCGIIIISLLICITVYDIKHTIIPNAWVYLFSLAAFLLHAPQLSAPGVFAGCIEGALAAVAPLFILWLMSRGRWMGFGDVKLAIGIGFLLGFPDGFIAVMASFILGSIIMVPLLLAVRSIGSFTHRDLFLASRKHLTMKSEVPFGPFLIASCLLVWFLHFAGVSVALSWFSIV